MGRILEPSGSLRSLARESGLSEHTISKISTTGRIPSIHTGAALERATNNAITVEKHVQSNPKGQLIYSEFPGNEILRIALATKQTPTSIMSSLGINQYDLALYIKKDGKPHAAVARRIKAAIDMLPTIGGNK